MWSTRRLNDMGCLPLVCYALGAHAAGYPRSWRPTTRDTSPGAIPEPRPAGGTCGCS
jgi:hypothetical protein